MRAVNTASCQPRLLLLLLLLLLLHTCIRAATTTYTGPGEQQPSLQAFTANPSDAVSQQQAHAPRLGLRPLYK
jgi:hypothetical protein